MSTASFHMPGALRMRDLVPLMDSGGSCSLVYDLERALIVEVPDEFQLHIALALETSEPDLDLWGWLVSEDLLTAEGKAAHLPRSDDEVHGLIVEGAEARALEALELVFRRGQGATRIKLHFDWVGGFPGNGLLERLVSEATRRAAVNGQEIGFELALDSSRVTSAVAGRLAGLQIGIRLRCGEVDHLGDRPWLLAEPAVLRLLRRHEERLVVQCVLGGNARLLDLWQWAKQIGIRHLDVIRLEPEPLQPRALESEIRNDLLAICQEIYFELAQRRLPIDFQPVTRIVRRLMRSEPQLSLSEQPRLSPGLAVDDFSLSQLASVDARLLSALAWSSSVEGAQRSLVREGAGLGDASDSGDSESEGGPGTFPCHGCWARQVCSHSAFVASPLRGEDPREPSEICCSYWKLEVESALRLYHKLAQIDPIQVLRFFEESVKLPVHDVTGLPPGMWWRPSAPEDPPAGEPSRG